MNCFWERIYNSPRKKHTDGIRAAVNCFGIVAGIIHANKVEGRQEMTSTF